MSQLKIRSANITDADEFVRIAHEGIAASGYPEEQIAAWASGFTAEAMVNAIGQSISLVVEVNGEIAGFATLVDRGEDSGAMDLLYVDPKFSRRGVGKLLVRAIEDEARQREMSAIWVDSSDAAVYRLQQLGYRVHERYKKSVDSVVFKNTWMRKSFV